MTAPGGDGQWSADSVVTADAPGGGLFPFPVQPFTARRQLRLAVVYVLKNAELIVGSKSVSVDSPGDWPYPQQDLPAACVRSPSDNKQSLTKGNTDYTTTVEVDVRAAVSASTAEAAQDQIESLWFQIEQAILTNFYLLEIVQNVASVESTFDVKAEGQTHFAGAKGVFRFETFETFDIAQPAGALVAPSAPNAIGPLTEVNLDVTRPNSNPPYSSQPDDVGLTVTLAEG